MIVRLSPAAYSVLALDRVPSAVYGLTPLGTPDSGYGRWYAVTEEWRVALTAQCLSRWGGAVHRHHPVAVLARRLGVSDSWSLGR